MKLKRIGLGILTAAFVFTLVGCSNDPQKEFVDALYSTEQSTFNAAKFEMSIDNIDFSSDEDDSAYTAMMVSQLENITVDGSYALNQDDETMEMEMNLNALGQTLPLQFVIQKEKMYLSASFFSGAVDIANALQYPIDISASDLKKLDGKYIDVGEVGSEFTDGASSSSDVAAAAGTVNDKELQDKLRKLMESFDKKTFTKKDDVITHIFTKKEITQIAEVIMESLEDSKSGKTDKSSVDITEMFSEGLEDLSVELSINTKSSAMSYKFNMVIKDETTDMDLTLSMKMTPQKNTEKISVPSKKNVLTTDEFDAIISSIYGSAMGRSADSSYYDDLYGDLYEDEDYAFTDEEFDQLIESIEMYPEEITQEDADELRDSGSLIFSKDQMKRLNEALDKALL
ncbi:hypothetical protein IW492_06555 [Enterococcus sp. BWB1-3]|uniref:hypothetical protein n=1 Tax=Enterococcus sp. BWB1-3 TaxID=2787713 RepID=UPI00192221FD|nr:hypothetical protein [Enterococcus sp. BWB1-3]MBL1228893.1 hypothetical protein [Enterococcus sp. BWB1-3]